MNIYSACITSRISMPLIFWKIGFEKELYICIINIRLEVV